MSRNSILLGQLKDKVITMDQFMKACAKWTAEIAGSYHFFPLPEKPKPVEGYESLPDSIKRNLAIEYFNDHPQVKEYYSAIKDLKHRNQATYDWLKDCLKLVDTEEEKAAIINKLGEVKDEELWKK